MTRKLVAIALLIAAVWIIGSILTSIVFARIRLSQEISDLKEQAISLRARRYDISSLEKQLRDLTASQSLHHAAFIAQTDRGAIAELQRVVRSNIQAAHGTLLSVSETKATRESALGLQVHARLPESQLKQLVERFETGDPRLTIGSLSVISKSSAPNLEADIELTAVVQALWLKPIVLSP
jgi:biopolymer transport protein ExbB/TolQ